MKNMINLKSIRRIVWLIALAAIIGFSFAACGDGGGGGGEDPVVLTMKFNENTGWNEAGHEDWCRWHYKYTGANTKTLDSNKTYVLAASFTSNVAIDKLIVLFIKEDGWVEVSDYTDIHIPGPIPKNTRYNFSIPLFPKSNASDFLYVMIGNRENNTNNSTAPVLSFYEFSLEPVNKETAGLTKWTVSGKDIDVIDTRRTFAETVTYQGKSNVFHIKPTYNATTYDHNVMWYDLSAYAGKKIGVEMSFDAWINKEARIAWQMLIAPDYPLVCGYLDSTYFLPANTWQNISGNTIVSVPGSGGKLYLSGMQINGAEAYFANATLVINEGTSTPDTAVTLNSVTADGSSSSKTTQLTLTFSQAITGLTAANINLGSSISGLTKGTLSGSGPTYTLPITGFTAGGSLSVSVTKLGYNITPSKTVTIYGGSGSGSGGDGGNEGEFSNLDGLKDWLNGKGNNTKDNPYNIKIKFGNLSGLRDFLKGLSGKYVNLDFSDSNMTGIGADAFKDLANLIRITLPSTINSIGANAFNGCTNLISVTFRGTIPSGSFDTNAFSGLGDLRDKYLVGGAGTYTRQSGGTTWTKDGGGGTAVTLNSVTANGSNTQTTTQLTLTFSQAITGLSADNITLSGVSVTKGTLSGSGPTYTLPITVTTGGTLNIAAAKSGYTISGSPKTATIYYYSGGGGDTAVTLSEVTANGSASSTTTQLTLTFSQAITGLSADNITLSGVSVTKGTLSGSGPTYTLPISGFTEGGTLNVAVAKSGYTISGSPKTATIYFVFTLSGVIANGHSSQTTTQLTLTFNGAITGLSADDITLSGVTGVNKGTLSGSGPTYTLPISGFTEGGTLTVAVAKSGYTISGSPKTATIYYSWKWTKVTTTAFGTGVTVYDIAYGNDKFVAVGSSGKIAYSSDGITWTAASNPTFGSSDIIYGIAWGNDKFVAVGANQMVYSSDGITWTKVTSSSFNTSSFDGGVIGIRSITWGNNKFVAVAAQGQIAYSSDGMTWTRATSPFDNTEHLYSIVWGNDKFVAVGANTTYSGIMAYSSDGITWTKVTYYNQTYYGVAWGNDKFVVVGVNGNISYSSNGISWTKATGNVFNSNDINGIAWGNNRFVAVGNLATAAYSSNGINWTIATTSGTFDDRPAGDNTNNNSVIRGVAYGNNKFVAVGARGQIAYAPGN